MPRDVFDFMMQDDAWRDDDRRQAIDDDAHEPAVAIARALADDERALEKEQPHG